VSILSLHHVQLNIPAGQSDEARRFYAELLGLEEMPRPRSLSAAGRKGAWYHCGDQELHIFFNPDPESTSDTSSRHPAFLMDGLGALADRLREAGVPVEQAIPIDGRERFFCRDPGGNRLEFLSLT